MKILVTGAGGLLGPYLVEGLAPLGTVTPLTRAECDLRDATAVDHVMKREIPDVIVHTAAFTDVDGCERDPERARLDNVVASGHVAKACPPGAHLIVVSTDQVYPDTEGPHQEEDVGPVNVYGRTKLEGERAAQLHARTLVLRANFFGPSRTPGRSSLSDVIVSTLREGRSFPGFVDSFFSPLHLQTLASQISGCISRELVGVYNLGGHDGRSKGEFAQMIARHLGFDEALVVPTVSARIGGRAVRPRDLRMSVDAYVAVTGAQLPTLQEEVTRL